MIEDRRIRLTKALNALAVLAALATVTALSAGLTRFPILFALTALIAGLTSFATNRVRLVTGGDLITLTTFSSGLFALSGLFTFAAFSGGLATSRADLDGVAGAAGLAVFASGLVVLANMLTDVEDRLIPSLRRLFIRVRTVVRDKAVCRRKVEANTAIFQRAVATTLFAGAFGLVPRQVREEFGDEPIQHFLADWNERERGRWAWALGEIVQMAWVAGVERLRVAWQAVTQK